MAPDRSLREQLEGMQLLTRRRPNDIGERAAPVDPELPATHVLTARSAVSTRPRVSGIAHADTMTSAYAAIVKPVMASPSANRALNKPISEGQKPPKPRPTLYGNPWP